MGKDILITLILDSARVMFKMEGSDLVQESCDSGTCTGNGADMAYAKKRYLKVVRGRFPKEDFDMGL